MRASIELSPNNATNQFQLNSPTKPQFNPPTMRMMSVTTFRTFTPVSIGRKSLRGARNVPARKTGPPRRAPLSVGLGFRNAQMSMNVDGAFEPLVSPRWTSKKATGFANKSRLSDKPDDSETASELPIES